MKQDWWESFFTPEAGEIMFANKTPELTRREVDRLLALTKPPAGARILDIACGQGRHTLELARRGYRVAGLDYCAGYLAEARRRRRREKLDKRIYLVRGDMRQAARHFPPATFDLAIILFTSLGFFARRSDDCRVIAQAAKLLKPGGKLVINTLNRAGNIRQLNTVPGMIGLKGLAFWHESRPGVYVLDRAQYDSSSKRVFGEWVYIDVFKRKIRKFHLRLNMYSPADFRRMFAKCGLRLIRIWGQLSRGPFRPNSTHQTLIAQKPK